MESLGQILVSGKRHRGKKRNQQDAFFIGVTPTENYLLVVADGMSSPGHGDIVSQIATDTTEEILETYDTINNSPQSLFKEIFVTTYNRIRNAIKREPSLEGMGTTLTMAYLQEDVVYYFHIGDSRIYHIRDDEIIQITTDHVPPNGSKHELTQAVGVKQMVPEQLNDNNDKIILRPHTGQFHLVPDDRILLCSDGLYNAVDEETIRQIVVAAETPEIASARLIEQAKEGRDNISVIVLFHESRHRNSENGERRTENGKRNMENGTSAFCLPPSDLRPPTSDFKTPICEIVRRIHFTLESTGDVMDFVQTTGEFVPLESSCSYLPEGLPFPFRFHQDATSMELKAAGNSLQSFSHFSDTVIMPFKDLPPLVQIRERSERAKRQFDERSESAKRLFTIREKLSLTSGLRSTLSRAFAHEWMRQGTDEALEKLYAERVILTMNANQIGLELVRQLSPDKKTIQQIQHEMIVLMEKQNISDAAYLSIYEQWRIRTLDNHTHSTSIISDFRQKAEKILIKFKRKLGD